MKQLDSVKFVKNHWTLMGSLFGSRGGWVVEGVALFSYAVIVVEEG